MSIRLLPALAILVTFWVPAAAFAQDQQTPGRSKSGLFIMNEKARIDNISRADLFEPLDISQLDTRTGRQVERKHKVLPNDVTIECYYEQETLGGATEKFKCVGPEEPNDRKSRLPVIVTDARWG